MMDKLNPFQRTGKTRRKRRSKRFVSITGVQVWLVVPLLLLDVFLSDTLIVGKRHCGGSGLSRVYLLTLSTPENRGLLQSSKYSVSYTGFLCRRTGKVV